MYPTGGVSRDPPVTPSHSVPGSDASASSLDSRVSGVAAASMPSTYLGEAVGGFNADIKIRAWDVVVAPLTAVWSWIMALIHAVGSLLTGLSVRSAPEMSPSGIAPLPTTEEEDAVEQRMVFEMVADTYSRFNEGWAERAALRERPDLPSLSAEELTALKETYEREQCALERGWLVNLSVEIQIKRITEAYFWQDEPRTEAGMFKKRPKDLPGLKDGELKAYALRMAYQMIQKNMRPLGVGCPNGTKDEISEVLNSEKVKKLPKKSNGFLAKENLEEIREMGGVYGLQKKMMKAYRAQYKTIIK